MHDEYYDDTDADYHTTDYIPKMRKVFWSLCNSDMPPTICKSSLVKNDFELKPIGKNIHRKSFQKTYKALTIMKNGMDRNMHHSLCTMDER